MGSLNVLSWQSSLCRWQSFQCLVLSMSLSRIQAFNIDLSVTIAVLAGKGVALIQLAPVRTLILSRSQQSLSGSPSESYPHKFVIMTLWALVHLAETRLNDATVAQSDVAGLPQCSKVSRLAVQKSLLYDCSADGSE